MITVVAYVRVSSKEQHQEGYSIPAQRQLLAEYAQKHSLDVVKLFQEVETAKKAGRTQFNRMLSYVKRHKSVSAILVEKTDRLYRNFHDLVKVEDLGVEVHLVKEGQTVSPDSRSSDKLSHNIKVVLARNYIDNLSEETAKGMLEKARQGLYPSFAPLGYLNDKETASIIPDPERAPLIRKIFEAYATGRESYESLVTLAFRMGLRTRKGNAISKSAIGKMLIKPTYVGDFVWNGVTYTGKYEPIISRALFDQVQERRNAVTYSNPKKHDHAFRGLVRCGTCGCMVTGQTKKQIYTYYHCTHGRGDCSEKAVRSETVTIPPLRGRLGHLKVAGIFS